MDNVAVFGHHRRKGVGSAIVEALAAGPNAGAGIYLLEVRPSNAQACGCIPAWALRKRAGAGILFQPHRGCAFAHQKVLITVTFRGRKRQRAALLQPSSKKLFERSESSFVGGLEHKVLCQAFCERKRERKWFGVIILGIEKLLRRDGGSSGGGWKEGSLLCNRLSGGGT